ncbi:hypothetical protein ACSLPG_30635, partial [Escherichia coli]
MRNPVRISGSAQITGADLTRPLSDNQFEQLYHAVLRHQVVFL